MKIYALLALMVMMIFLFANGFGQSNQCGSFDRNVNYKILFKDIDTVESEIFLEIYLKPEKFAVDSMIKLAERLRTEYCGFNSVSVRFYGVKKLDRVPDPPPHPLFEWESKSPMRGFYELNRKESKQEISFREKPNGKATTILFKSDGYCVSDL